MSLRERICSNAALLGEDGLVALANRGLVRRARKDLETATPEDPQETTEGLTWRWDQQTVLLRERPAESRCSCPAGGICRHILACLVHAATLAQAAPAAPVACGDEILALTDEQIEQWASKALVKRARRELALGLVVNAQDGSPFIARIGDWNVECRWLPGGGPGGMVCSCHDPQACIHRVTAVLAWQVERGGRTIEREESVLEESAGAVRTRAEVANAVAVLCEDIVQLGFTRLTNGHSERCRTLALSAHGVDLPRLERLLQGLANTIASWLARDPQANDVHLLAQVAGAWALSKALRTPSADLVGVHRLQYERVQRLDLAGAGCECWQTPSGYHGLTVYFWDAAARSWCTWSEARPLTTGGFDPLGRVGAPGPWQGAVSPKQLSTTTGALMNGWRSRTKRLSGRGSSRWSELHRTTPVDLPPAISDWLDLRARWQDLHPIGLQSRAAMADLVLVRPEQWLPATFDTLRQVLVRPLLDAHGHRLLIRVPQVEHLQSLLTRVEHWSATPQQVLLGRLFVSEDGPAMHPISVIDANGPVSLSLNRSERQSAAGSAVTHVASSDEDEDTPDGDENLPIGSSPVLDRAAGLCLAAANAGMRAFRQWPNVIATAEEAAAQGMTCTADALRRLAKPAVTDRAARLLLAGWVLHQQQQALRTEQLLA